MPLADILFDVLDLLAQAFDGGLEVEIPALGGRAKRCDELGVAAA